MTGIQWLMHFSTSISLKMPKDMVLNGGWLALSSKVVRFSYAISHLTTTLQNKAIHDNNTTKISTNLHYIWHRYFILRKWERQQGWQQTHVVSTARKYLFAPARNNLEHTRFEVLFLRPGLHLTTLMVNSL